MRTIILASLSLLLAACHVGPQTTASVEQLAAPAPEPELEPEVAPELPSAMSAVLERGVAHRAGITEVVLDPRGEAALTLDADGGVRLWPQLVADAAASTPYRIPVHEPLSLSLGKRGQGFTLAFIGTNNAGTIFEVEQPAKGPATIVESFALSPEQPLLELHVLDGGEQILALGVDHRVRLYTSDGALLSEIDERSFAPWQLRVSGGVGESPKLLAVLAQPLRVQPLQLVGGQLEIAGPARTVELDRGPNGNDLALSPDGTTVAALRRPDKHGRQWSVELIDLATDTRKLVAGKADSKVRPRMHFHANDRLLLEDGSGQAWIVELAQAVEPRKAEDLHPDSDFAKRLAKRLVHQAVALPASGERDMSVPDDDQGIRMHASVVNGVRASIDVSAGRRLVVGALDQPKQLSFAQPPTKLTDAALDANGSTVMWVSGSVRYLETVGQHSETLPKASQAELAGWGDERSTTAEEEEWMLELPGRRTKAIAPSPVGNRVAVAKLRENWRSEIELSIADSESHELVWTVSIEDARGDATVSWSADGTRLAVVSGGVGRVFAADDGALLHERLHLPLEVQEIDASMPSNWVPDPVQRRETFSGFAD